MEELEPGRREQNKQRTRRALEIAAAHLFEKKGFEATTIRDITIAAGVGERTFFRYFPSKEDLVLQQARDAIPGLMRRVREHPAGDPLLAALRTAILDWLDETGAPPTILVTGPPTALDRHHNEAHTLIKDLEESLTDAFLDRLEAEGQDRGDRSVLLRAAVQARAGVAVLRSMVLIVPGRTRCGTDVPATPAGPALSNDQAKQLVCDAFAALES